MTIGDEFQATYRTLDDAVAASLRIQLLLTGRTDVRFGIGWGGLTTYSARRAPLAQDGPAWWAARSMLLEIDAAAGRRGQPRAWRTGLRIASDQHDATEPAWQQLALPGMERELPLPPRLPSTPAALERLLNAYLMCRDEIVSGFDMTDARIALGALDGRRQSSLGTEVGISQPSVAKRLTRNGIRTLVSAESFMVGLTR
jgi:hypothetical protein